MNRPTVSRGGGPPRGGRGGPRGGGRGRGSAVLQRANAQLKGQRVPIPQTQEKDDDDDLGAYLSNLSRKTKEPQLDKFGESDIDISISSDDQPKPTATPAAASKFLKKKPQETKENATDSKFLKKPGMPASPALTSKSSALNKAAAFVSKFSEKPQKKVVDISDSDLDMDLSMDSDIVADVRSLKQPEPVAKQPGKKQQSKPVAVEKPKRSSSKSPARKAESPSYGDESISIGLDGSKFTQKKSKSYANFEMSDSSASDAIGKGGSKFLKKKPKAASPPPPKSPEGRNSPASPQRQSMFRLKSADKYNTQVVLDTDEESLADFIGGLSSSTDPGSARTPRTPKSPSSARQAASKQFLKPKLSPVGRPSPEPIIDTIREVDEPLEESVKSESSIEEDSFKIKVFDLEDLEPAVDLQPSKPSKHSTKRSSPSKTRTPRSPKEKSRKKESKKDAKKSSKKAAASDSFFSSMGLQTVDDLLGGVGDSPPEEIPSEVEEDVHRSPTPLRSILSPTPRSYTPRRVRLSLSEVMEVRSRSPSPEPISTARAITSRIYTEDFEEEGSESAASIHTSDVSDTESIRTLTEHSGRSSPGARSYSRQSSLTRQRSEDYYSDDFTETSVASRRRTYYSSDATETSSYSEDYTSYTSRTSSPRSPRSPRTRPMTRSIRVQTAEVPGLWYQWDKEAAGQAGVTPPLGLHSVDPTPIATHVVSSDALEALTGYSPSVLALNDMLRQQLELTQHFVHAQRRIYESYVGSAIPDHRYTTLQDTKAYIAKHRKPKLTFDEALRQVKAEMGLD